MKKIITLFLITISFCLIGMAKVSAAELRQKLVVIVEGLGNDTITINTETGANMTGFYKNNAKVGDTVTFQAMTCSISDDMVYTEGRAHVPISSCQAIDATYRTSNPSDLQIENNVGTIIRLPESVWVTITATAEGYSDAVAHLSIKDTDEDSTTTETPPTTTTDDTTNDTNVPTNSNDNQSTNDEGDDNDETNINDETNTNEDETNVPKTTGAEEKSTTKDVKVGDTASNRSIVIVITGVILLGVGCSILYTAQKKIEPIKK